MKLACNYYPETEALVRAGKIDIDYFKFPALGYQMDILSDEDAFAGFAARVGALRPILLHGLYPSTHDVSSPALAEAFDFAAMDRFIRMTETPGVSFHPGPGKDGLGVIIKNLRFLSERYAHMDFVSVENIPPTPCDNPLAQPEVITEMVTQSGCSLLLDISHAYCAARALGEDFRAYLSKLPLEHIYEIHINGWIEKGPDIMCHVKINELGYQVLEELLQCCDPKIITIEYGRDVDRIGAGSPIMRADRMNAQAEDEIVEQVARIREIME